MTLGVATIAMVLGAAVLHASWNAIVKSGNDRLLVLTGVNLVGAAVGVLLIGWVGAPASASWPFLALSVLLHSGYYLFLIRAYQHGDLSQIYPLARGAAPLLVAMGAALAAGERLPPQGIAGMLIACAGITSLAFEKGPPWRRNRQAVLYALGTSAWIAGYTIADGLGVRASSNPLGYIAWLFFLEGIPLTLFALHRRRGAVATFVRQRWQFCLAGGLASVLAYGLVIYAMNSAVMAAVSALRETSVIMAAAIGAIFLGERFGWPRIAAVILVAAGVVLMEIA